LNIFEGNREKRPACKAPWPKHHRLGYNTASAVTHIEMRIIVWTDKRNLNRHVKRLSHLPPAALQQRSRTRRPDKHIVGGYFENGSNRIPRFATTEVSRHVTRLWPQRAYLLPAVLRQRQRPCKWAEHLIRIFQNSINLSRPARHLGYSAPAAAQLAAAPAFMQTGRKPDGGNVSGI